MAHYYLLVIFILIINHGIISTSLIFRDINDVSDNRNNKATEFWPSFDDEPTKFDLSSVIRTTLMPNGMTTDDNLNKKIQSTLQVTTITIEKMNKNYFSSESNLNLITYSSTNLTKFNKDSKIKNDEFIRKQGKISNKIVLV